MTRSTLDPARISDGGGDVPFLLRDLFDSAQRDLGTASELEGVERRLRPLFVASVAPEAGASIAIQSQTTPVAAKLLAVALIGGLLGGLALVTARTGEVPTLRRAPLASSFTLRVEPPGAPAQAAEMPPLEATPVRESHARGARSTGAPKRRSGEPAAGPPDRAAKAPAQDRVGELMLLRRARAALASDLRRALDLAAEHRRTYPQGALSQEREVIAIEASHRLGDERAARERARSFSERYPDSAHRARVNATLEGGGDAKP